MAVNAVLRFARIAPRKARLVADAIRGLPVVQAEVRLRTLEPRAARMLEKLLKSAVANAKQNFSLDPKELHIERVLVNEGPRLKRWMPRARGSANRIIKKTSHIEVILAGKDEATRATPLKGKKSDIETKRVEELRPEELKSAGASTTPEQRRDNESGSVKPAESPRGAKRLLERKHGGT
ncbi:MAG: large subunit ribosomal protein L22 [Parcubacteria group bacterium Gr01-1014_106]|nr:MAG: large subunit ribosomal protein L22 [Parcubacteria group bacterium Gr01-1014_106]